MRPSAPDNVSVFLRAPSLEEYERRLRKRATEDEASIQRRLAAARAELALAPTYSYQIINDDLNSATARLRAFVADQFARAHHDG